ncbi:hypothetical protein JG687_00002385 [Phytophthora cactorum]|uniref:Uncharacterized protein n=2 Tax=Phytophthora TaxID=4783 RepID=A0A329SU93_9STRA|nr:hypothetical protein PC114_g5459 [Phytophthora cactorum]KAG6975467.1 hypothetical protein JG688_00002362 [Phytophthora aleatoria]KAG3202339.1 hypothetical protein PC128_g3279 [Phytophthora cactorum]KAG4048955.1 hypothetical protein PC123_g15747 [Phytophthora cactorum]KAG4249447.1 hypothetical protein PC116_g2844 [Phytophthora cactorum]
MHICINIFLGLARSFADALTCIRVDCDEWNSAFITDLCCGLLELATIHVGGPCLLAI